MESLDGGRRGIPAQRECNYLGTVENVGEASRFGAPAGGKCHPGLLALRIAYAEDDLMAYGGEGGTEATADVARSHDRHPHLQYFRALRPAAVGGPFCEAIATAAGEAPGRSQHRSRLKRPSARLRTWSRRYDHVVWMAARRAAVSGGGRRL